jgi:catechol O-methyltransferase
MSEISDLVQKIEREPLRVSDYVTANVEKGDAAGVLAAMDHYAREIAFLINIGPDKGGLIQKVFDRVPKNPRVLELGAFVGYSAILFAMQVGEGGSVVSLEIGEEHAEASRRNVAHAGFEDRVDIIQGDSGDSIPNLVGPFDVVFLDHWKDLYKRDLQAIETSGLLRPGSIVVADNVGESFNPTEYLEYVRTCGRYESEHLPATVEYSTLPDAVEVSVFRP